MRSGWLVIGLCGVAAAQGTEMELESKMPKPRRHPDAPADAWIATALDDETSADSYCDRNLRGARKDSKAPSAKNTCGPFAHKARIKLAAPWTIAKPIQLDEHDGPNSYVPLSQYIELVVQANGSWYTHRLAHVPHPSSGDLQKSVTLRSITVKDVIPGGTPELLIESADAEETKMNGAWPGSAKREYLDVCSIGSSGTPSCVRATLAEDVVSTSLPEDTQRYRLTWRFDKKGRLLLRAKAPWPRNLPKRDFEETRPLFFP